MINSERDVLLLRICKAVESCARCLVPVYIWFAAKILVAFWITFRDLGQLAFNLLK